MSKKNRKIFSYSLLNKKNTIIQYLKRWEIIFIGITHEDLDKILIELKNKNVQQCFIKYLF